jgi:2-C-methyl-D-erythritol 4-phosphate cytidylyltransferase
LIVAGGSGKRMKMQIPKQFLLLGGYPVLMHTLERFHRYDPAMRILLVLPEIQHKHWKDLCLKYQFTIPHETGTGGETRFHSVKNNLHTIPDNCLVAIHDGVRPLVSVDTISRCFVAAHRHGNAVPCIEIPETMRMLDGEESQLVDRSKYRLIQTPQVFIARILKLAYCQEYKVHFTDDASVVESLGTKIHLVEGNPENLKITLKKDMDIAGVLLKGEKQPSIPFIDPETQDKTNRTDTRKDK